MPGILGKIRSLPYMSTSGNIAKLKELSDGNLAKLIILLGQNSVQKVAEMQALVASDESLTEQLRNIGITSVDMLVSDKTKSMSLLGGVFIGRVAQFGVSIATDLISGKLTADDANIAKTLLLDFAGVLPFAGPVVSQLDTTSKVLSKLKPEAVAAYKDYMKLQGEYYEELEALHSQLRTEKLTTVFGANPIEASTAIAKF